MPSLHKIRNMHMHVRKQMAPACREWVLQCFFFDRFYIWFVCISFIGVELGDWFEVTMLPCCPGSRSNGPTWIIFLTLRAYAYTVHYTYMYRGSYNRTTPWCSASRFSVRDSHCTLSVWSLCNTAVLLVKLAGATHCTLDEGFNPILYDSRLLHFAEFRFAITFRTGHKL